MYKRRKVHLKKNYQQFFCAFFRCPRFLVYEITFMPVFIYACTYSILYTFPVAARRNKYKKRRQICDCFYSYPLGPLTTLTLANISKSSTCHTGSKRKKTKRKDKQIEGNWGVCGAYSDDSKITWSSFAYPFFHEQLPLCCMRTN